MATTDLRLEEPGSLARPGAIGNLGVSFVLSASLGTPGCEMRSFHHLFSLMTGKPAAEHHCPVGPLSAIDKWETSRA